jgi:hypothetical protein
MMHPASGVVRTGLIIGLACAAAAPVAGAKELAVASEAATSTLEEQREQVRQQLDGTQWTLVLRPEGGGKTTEDTLTFKGRTVASARLTKAGYSTTNYSVHVQDDGVAVWETMQSKEGGDRAFWRGDLSGETMSGILSKQPAEQPQETFYFSATKLASGQPQTPPASIAPAPTLPPQAQLAQPEGPVAGVAAQVSPEVPAPPSAPAAAPKKKRRGWF